MHQPRGKDGPQTGDNGAFYILNCQSRWVTKAKLLNQQRSILMCSKNFICIIEEGCIQVLGPRVHWQHSTATMFTSRGGSKIHEKYDSNFTVHMQGEAVSDTLAALVTIFVLYLPLPLRFCCAMVPSTVHQEKF